MGPGGEHDDDNSMPPALEGRRRKRRHSLCLHAADDRPGDICGRPRCRHAVSERADGGAARLHGELRPAPGLRRASQTFARAPRRCSDAVGPTTRSRSANRARRPPVGAGYGPPGGDGDAVAADRSRIFRDDPRCRLNRGDSLGLTQFDDEHGRSPALAEPLELWRYALCGLGRGTRTAAGVVLLGAAHARATHAGRRLRRRAACNPPSSRTKPLCAC